MKQQELADKIGINMQSLSKIERGVNYPTFDTLEKIMDVLGVTPNELLSGKWKYVNQAEKEVCQFLRTEERLNAELKHGHYDNFFDSEEEWLEYELEQLRKYITDYINGTEIQASDLYPIKEFIQHLKFQKILNRYGFIQHGYVWGKHRRTQVRYALSGCKNDKPQFKRRYGTVTGSIKE